MSDNDTHDDFYNFIINDDNELILLVYSQDTPPSNAIMFIQNDNLILWRNPSADPDDYIKFMKDPDSSQVFRMIRDSLSTVLVTELSRTDNEDDTEIVYVYQARIAHTFDQIKEFMDNPADDETSLTDAN